MDDGDGLPPDRRNRENVTDSDSEDGTGVRPQVVELDLGDDNIRKNENSRLGNNIGAGSSSADGTRREENPFSFKHFLRCDKNYHNKGARPKVYCDGRPVSNVLDTQAGQIISENPSVLPDFVQDHLVLEQSYLLNGPNANYIGVQLPDFTRNNVNAEQNVEGVEHNVNSINGEILGHVRPQAEFPLDLPLPCSNIRQGNSNEVAVSKSLPDFLNDGAVRSQTTDNLSDNQSPETPERLQRELDLVRRQLVEQSNRAEILSRELEGVRNKEQEYTQSLIKALEQVEDNLERSNRRAATSESTILRLKEEIKVLKRENSILRQEKSGCGEGALGGPRDSSQSHHSQRLAQELRNAASTAENSLRQLLSGVDNLRLMASTLENIYRFEERNERMFNSDENSGPAL